MQKLFNFFFLCKIFLSTWPKHLFTNADNLADNFYTAKTKYNPFKQWCFGFIIALESRLLKDSCREAASPYINIVQVRTLFR